MTKEYTIKFETLPSTDWKIEPFKVIVQEPRFKVSTDFEERKPVSDNFKFTFEEDNSDLIFPYIRKLNVRMKPCEVKIYQYPAPIWSPKTVAKVWIINGVTSDLYSDQDIDRLVQREIAKLQAIRNSNHSYKNILFTSKKYKKNIKNLVKILNERN